MKNKVIKRTLIAMFIATSSSYAQPITWLEGGQSVYAELQDTNISINYNNRTKTQNSAKLEDKAFEVKLATGNKATVVGGVYVKTTEVKTVLNWASENGYIAKEHDVIKGAVKIKTTPNQAIEVASKVAKLEGVTTAAPTLAKKRYKR